MEEADSQCESETLVASQDRRVAEARGLNSVRDPQQQDWGKKLQRRKNDEY